MANRAKRLASTRPLKGLDDFVVSVQFLRGVASLSVLSLSSFYLYLATNIKENNQCSIAGYPGKILQNQIYFSSLNTIALACRKAFDQGPKGLTGAKFGTASAETLEKHAKYWAENSDQSVEDAYRALHFLQTIFAKCSKSPSVLLKSESTLGRIIGFMKLYANRSAAHLTLDEYEFDGFDVAHVVAALALVGSIICSFDDDSPPDYFNQIDKAAFDGAITLFPSLPKTRLFEDMNIAKQGRNYWQFGEELGIRMLMDQLLHAIGWFRS